MCSLSTVSARMEPITKAPSADENPARFARVHTEAEADANYQQYLVVYILLGPLQYAGDQPDADDEPQDEEETQFGKVEEHLSPGELVGYRQRGEQHHQEDGEHFFDDEVAEHHGGVRGVLKPHLVV